MNITRFGSLEGRPVTCVTLRAGALSCQILNYGGAVRQLLVPDRNGRPVDVVLGFDTLEDYVDHSCYFGALIGPVANRIGGASIDLGGRRLQLDRNDGENSLHGGSAGFDRKLWDIEAAEEDSLSLCYTHPDGLGGYPGPLEVHVRYTLRPDRLCIDYRARAAQDTVCSLTNHSYFNLDGHDSGPVTAQRIRLFSHSCTPTDAASIPTGAIRAVSGPMDLSKLTPIGAHIDDDEPQLRLAGGYDHNWVVDPGDEAGFRPAAEAFGAKTGIRLRCYTDRPGLQFYSGNYIPEGLRGKDGAVYGRRHGFCLETQAFPDAPHHPSFPPIVLRAGREWISRTEYRFA